MSQFQVIARVIVDYKNKLERKHALLARVAEATTDDEKKELLRISSSYEISATVLPIRTVGVQGEYFFFIQFQLLIIKIFSCKVTREVIVMFLGCQARWILIGMI